MACFDAFQGSFALGDISSRCHHIDDIREGLGGGMRWNRPGAAFGRVCGSVVVVRVHLDILLAGKQNSKNDRRVLSFQEQIAGLPAFFELEQELARLRNEHKAPPLKSINKKKLLLFALFRA